VIFCQPSSVTLTLTLTLTFTLSLSLSLAYHDELMDVEEKESVSAEKDARDQSNADYKKYLSNAGCLYAFIIFDEMVENDPDLDKLKVRVHTCYIYIYIYIYISSILLPVSL